MFTSLLLVAALATGDPKVDREPSKGCWLTESFKSDLSSAGFKVVEGDRDFALRYLSTLVNIGAPAPPMDLSKLTGLVVVSSKEVPETVLVGLADSDGQICHAITIPMELHNAILRGA